MNPQSVSYILKEGMVIKTRLHANQAWYQNLVCKCEGPLIWIPLIHSYIENIILPGSRIEIKYSTEYFEYLFKGMVQEIQPENFGAVAIRIGSAEEIICNRAYPRYDVYLASAVKSVWNDGSYFSIVTNLSLGGMAFISSYGFDQGEECDISVFLPEQKTISTKGKIVRKSTLNKNFCYNVQFTEQNETVGRLISSYLSTLEKERVSMQENFFTSK